MTTSSKLCLNNKSRLCLLDLSAAFDTIDHSILLYRLLTWFDLNGKIISWLTCHQVGSWSLSTQLLLHAVLSVRVSCKDQSSVLFYLFSTLLLSLSSLISDSSVGHHMYTDDNQLFISFVNPEFSTNISHLQPTVNLISQ